MANAKRCSSSTSEMVKHMRQLSFDFFKGTQAMEECKGCKFNKAGSRYTYRICAACQGDANEAYDKVFVVTKTDRLVCQS